MTDEPSLSDLHALIRTSPDEAWPLVVEFVRGHPGSAEAEDFIEDLVYEHDERFLDQLEASALADPTFRAVIQQAYVGGVATTGAERFHELQRRLST